MMRVGAGTTYLHLSLFLPVSSKYEMIPHTDTGRRWYDTVFSDMTLSKMTLEFVRKKKNGGQVMSIVTAWFCFTSLEKSTVFN